MIRFPETAQAEWNVVAEAARADIEIRKRIEREVLVENEFERLRVRHEANLRLQHQLNADQTPTLELYSMADYLNNPASVPSDLIDGAVKDNGLCVLLGPSESGKTTIGLQMLHCLMSGDDWLGRPVTQIKGSVGIFSYDMSGEMVMDWMVGYPGIDPNKVSVVDAFKLGNPLGVPEYRERIAATWRAMNVEVVLLDSFSASFFGHDQNDAAATMAHYRDIKRFALTEVGARNVIVLAHSTESSPGKVRGSSVHKDTADSMVVVYPGKDGKRVIESGKYRAARGQTAMSPVIVTAPDPATHLVDLDLQAMNLAGHTLPATAATMMFSAVPDTHQAPDVGPDEDEDEGEIQ